MIGISSDADHTDFVAENNLSMTLLSDIGGKVRECEARFLRHIRYVCLMNCVEFYPLPSVSVQNWNQKHSVMS